MVLGGQPAQLPDLVKILKTTMEPGPGVFICIDALDECLPKCRLQLLKSLQEIVKASPTARVFLTGRPHVQDEVKKYFPGAIMIPIIPPIEDIKRYLSMRLEDDTIAGAMDSNLRAKIMEVIPGKISQMRVKIATMVFPRLPGYLLTENRFLLVSLNIDAVLEEPTIHKRKKKLEEMTQGNGLQGAYSTTLKRMQEQGGSKSSLGMGMLMWLSHSERPLETNELCDALGVDIGSVRRNSENIPTIEALLGFSLGLVVVEASTYTVRLVHRTLQEYLRDNADLFPNPHATITQVCLTYLNFQCIRALPPIPFQPQLETSLLEYASCYWGIHAGEGTYARREITESVNKLAVRLLDGFDEHVSSGILLSHNRDNWDGSLGRSDYTGFTGLHGAAYLGMVKIAAGLLDMKKWDHGVTDVMGNTAILWAVRKGHEAMVKMLLAREDTAPNTTDKNGSTPLLWAVRDGREGIVKMLLEREDLTPGTADKGGQTPLLRAVIDKHTDIVRMLLGREDLSPNTPDRYDQSPLSWAARNGNGNAVRMLLERRDVTPDTEDKGGRTALSWAAGNGDGGIVKMLLEREGEDVTPDTGDKDGRTVLSWAAGNGHGGIVKTILARRDVTPDTEDKGGRTALSWAAGSRHEGVVGILLEFGDVTPDSADKTGRTPLAWAAGNGNDNVVGMLLEREDVTPNTTDISGRSALLWAARFRRDRIVKMLLGRRDTIADTADKDGRTPLSWVAANGRDAIVKMLFEREDVAPDRADKNGRTPLAWAVVYGQGGVVKMLLEREDVAPDTRDKDGQTPLSWAAGSGNEDIVRMLLERGGVTPDTPHKNGQTPLSWAAERGHIRVVEMLLERFSIRHDILIADLAGQTALIQTSGEQPVGVIERRFGDQDSFPHTNNSISLVPTDPSESHNTLPTGSGDPDIDDNSSSPDEPPHSQCRYYTIMLLNFTLNSPLRALFLSSMCLWFLRILAIYLPILAYHIISFIYP